MDFLSNLLGIGASVASGGLFGLLGSVVGVAAKWFQEKQRQAWEAKKWEHEDKLLELQMKAKAQETEQELAIVSQTGAWEGLTTSIRADTAVKNVHVWVNDLRALFRPVLTILLAVGAYFVFRQIVTGKLSEWIDAHDVADLIKYMVYTVFFTASTAVVWWFGDRALTPPTMKNR